MIINIETGSIRGSKEIDLITLCLVTIPSQMLSESWLCVNGQES